jgi:cyclase
MPITVGGRIRSLGDIEKRLAVGADKVAINTKAIEDPEFVSIAAREFGSQCVVASIDFKEIDGTKLVVGSGGREVTDLNPCGWARRLEDLGAGEILLNSIDRDGMRTGYDLEAVDAVSRSVRIPVIACGGVGTWDHLAEGLEKTQADAVAAANIFHYTDQSVFLAKKHLAARKLDVRPPDLFAVRELRV